MQGAFNRPLIPSKSRVDQLTGVGLLGSIEYRFHVPLFDHLAIFHHHYAVTDGADYLEIVADKQIAQLVALLQGLQQFQNLELDTAVQR